MHSEITSPPSEMDSDALGKLVHDKASGLGIKMRDLRPFILEIWKRLEAGEIIYGCKSKKRFCEVVFHRTLRSVQLMLAKYNDAPEAEWVDKQKPLDDEQRYKRLYNFVDKQYVGDFDGLVRDVDSILGVQQRLAAIRK
jgi:hypothetical protein